MGITFLVPIISWLLHYVGRLGPSCSAIGSNGSPRSAVVDLLPLASGQLYYFSVFFAITTEWYWTDTLIHQTMRPLIDLHANAVIACLVVLGAEFEKWKCNWNALERDRNRQGKSQVEFFCYVLLVCWSPYGGSIQVEYMLVVKCGAFPTHT